VLAILGTTRGLSDPPFEDADVETFQLYLPHFREAMRVAARLHGLEQRGRTFAAMFDRLRIATLITDRFGQVEFQNEAARIVLARSTALSIVHGRIVANGGAANAALHEAIFNAAAGGAENGASRELLRIERPERDSGILVSVASSSRQPGAAPPVGGQLRATLFLCDPEARYEGDAEALQRLFGLTNAEASVMVLLSAGHAPKAIASQLGRSYETVRSHLKALFAKTGAKTQAELVGLVQTVAPPAPG
jgi:DNA-binding CsgD family transcriptional regulator